MPFEREIAEPGGRRPDGNSTDRVHLTLPSGGRLNGELLGEWDEPSAIGPLPDDNLNRPNRNCSNVSMELRAIMSMRQRQVSVHHARSIAETRNDTVTRS